MVVSFFQFIKYLIIHIILIFFEDHHMNKPLYIGLGVYLNVFYERTTQ